ncbi:xylose isomerase [Halomonas litopenaei]|uniref:Xylose isomerase n=1 Tax=Halomonas litopenaei TaxID=2109328 RepID=A0ABX5J1L8_9GAMM|nr:MULTISPECIES: TIM barrel protein [Halomonas]PTL90288.1 xylose isomerase [Halomonas sp. SYSU XM8]PTL95593.1 xylose isomerase [Halomonas litopenaei]
MPSRSLHFALNHMVCPRYSIEQLMRLAVELGIDAVELRNDVGDNSLATLEQAVAAGELARELGLSVLSVNALYPFNVWDKERAVQAEHLAERAAAAGARGLVLCPLVAAPDEAPTATDVVKALVELGATLDRHGLVGFVEPLGFPDSSLRLKADALAAIDEAVAILGPSEPARFSLVHDTFHHRGAGEAALFAARTGLVHLSGVEDPTLTFDAMLDGNRVLVGEGDRLDNVEQVRRLLADGYRGYLSFEPFAESVHALQDPADALARSIDVIRDGVA